MTSRFSSPRIRTALLPAIILIAAFQLMSCAPGVRLGSGPGELRSAASPAASAGLIIGTHDRTTFSFAENAWDLTLSGVRGHAVVEAQSGATTEKDTTLSYWDVASASPGSGRSNSMSQFLLTILGVILVIGLAAIILYASFLATDR